MNRIFHSVIRSSMQPKRNLFTPPNFSSKYNEYLQFIISATNCLLVVSILGFFEQYNEKMKIIDQCNNNLIYLISTCNNNTKSPNRKNTKQPVFLITNEDDDH
jgi:hypothetical protein